MSRQTDDFRAESAVRGYNASSRYRPALAVGLVSGVLAAALTGHLVNTALRSGFSADFPAHLAFTRTAIDTGRYPGNALFYLLNAVFAGFSTDRGRLVGGFVVVLMAAAAAKVWLSVGWVAAEHRTALAGRLPGWAAAAAALCVLAFSLPAATWYRGQLPPNVWHNSTTMLLMPFAIGLFWASLAYLRTGARRLVVVMLLLAVLNVAAKPSFVFCFLAVFPLAALAIRRGARDVLAALLVTVATAGMVVVQYVYIYGTRQDTANHQASGVAFDPLRVWSAYSDTMALSALCSYLFPLVAVLVAGPVVWRSLAVRYAGALAGAGLLCFILLKETGYRELHGNFGWQAVVTNYLLFLAVVSAAVPWLREQRFGWRPAIVVAAFALHVAAGVAYLHHYLTTGTYS